MKKIKDFAQSELDFDNQPIDDSDEELFNKLPEPQKSKNKTKPKSKTSK